MSHTHETEPGFELSDSKKLTAPAKIWLGLFAVLAGGVAAWVRAEMKAEATAERVDKVEIEQRALSVEQRAQRDILIRIDANVAAMKEAQSRK